MNQPEVQVQVDRRSAPQLTEVRLIRMKEVSAICGLSKSSIYEAIKHSGFPKPIRVYGRSTVWIKSEVLQWE
jgi:prophage regulatory protein